MAWYKKLFGISESPKEVSTGIEIGPGIQLMCGDQQPVVDQLQEPVVDNSDLSELKQKLSLYTERFDALHKAIEDAEREQKNQHIRLLRASAYPSIDRVIEALIEAQEGNFERLKEVSADRKRVKSLYPKL